MKKIFSIFCMMLLVGIAMSQQMHNLPAIIDVSKANSMTLSPLVTNPNTVNVPKRDYGEQRSYWINFPYTLCKGLSQDWGLNSSATPMNPDTTVMIRWLTTVATPTPHYEFAYQHAWWTSVGLTLNPFSDYLVLDTFFKDTPYSVDSIAIFYLYYRFSDPSIIDTLIVQLIQPDNLKAYTWKSNGKPAAAVPVYNRGQNIASMAAITKRFPLGPGDTMTFKGGHYYVKYIPISGFNVTKGGPCAVTWSFAPGRKITHGDTIPYQKWDSVQGVSNPDNLFFWNGYFDLTKTELDEYNNGNLINHQQRYNNVVTGWENVYLGGVIFTHSWIYPVADFKVTYTVTKQSVEHTALFDDMKVSLFPNPVRANSNFNITLNLEKSRMVTIELYDLIGHKISTVSTGLLTKGEHKINASTANLSSGVYFCKVSSGNTSNSYKVSVR
jgi:hypothetical protein